MADARRAQHIRGGVTTLGQSVSTKSRGICDQAVRTLLVGLCIPLVACEPRPAATQTAANTLTPTPMPTSTASPTPAPTSTHTATSRPTATSTPNATATPGAEAVEPVVSTLDFEEFEFRNCDNMTEDLVRPVSSVAPVQEKLSIADSATPVDGGGQAPLPDEMRATLEALVRQAYQETLAQAEAEGAADEFVVPPDKIITFRVLWREEKYTGAVSFTQDGVAYMVEYVYTLLVPKRAGNRTVACTA